MNDTSAPAMGSVIAGRYEVESLIASGGFGQVFLAHHVHLRSRVAIKLLRPAHAETAEIRRRFLREARVLAELSHPHIVRIHDLGELDTNTLYLVMEYIDGRPLSALVTAGELTPGRVVHLLGQAASALDYAHRRGIVHRDLKPPNIMVSSLDGHDDYAKLIDFGILKRYERTEGAEPTETAFSTATHVFVGTPAYMAPEQVRREEVSPATDQYALAIVAYECLTRRRPFTGASPIEVMSRRLSDPSPPLGRLADGSTAPAKVERVMRRAFAQDPAKRYPTVLDFIAELAEALPGSAETLHLPDSHQEMQEAIEERRQGLANAETMPLQGASPSKRRWVMGAAAVLLAGGTLAWSGLYPEQKSAPSEKAPPAPSEPRPSPEATALPTPAPAANAEPAQGAPARPPVPPVAPRLSDLAPARSAPRSAEPIAERFEASSGRSRTKGPGLLASMPKAPVSAASAPFARVELQGTSQLSVLVRPSAALYLDGQSFGDLGLHNRHLPAGTHTVKARAPSGQEVQATVKLLPDRQYRMRIDVEKGTWTISE